MEFFKVSDSPHIELDSALHIFQDGKEIVTILPSNFTAMPSRHVHLTEGDVVTVECYERPDQSDRP